MSNFDISAMSASGNKLRSVPLLNTRGLKGRIFFFFLFGSNPIESGCDWKLVLGFKRGAENLCALLSEAAFRS